MAAVPDAPAAQEWARCALGGAVCNGEFKNEDEETYRLQSLLRQAGTRGRRRGRVQCKDPLPTLTKSVAILKLGNEPKLLADDKRR
jgi:hypothetical protein